MQLRAIRLLRQPVEHPHGYPGRYRIGRQEAPADGPEIFKEFAAAFIAERDMIIARENAHFEAAKSELGRVKSQQKSLVKALKDGVSGRTVKDEMDALEAKEAS